MSIEAQQLEKWYGDQQAVKGISFSARRGEVVGFLGPNGAGKSTTMRMLTGYLPIDGGRAVVAGFDVAGQPNEVRRRIGYLPESNPQYPDMYIREYLSFVAELYRLPNRRETVERVIGLVGLTPEKHKKTGQLSKGYRQRVGLAAAILHRPEVLILDEPTSGLDPNQIVEIRQVIRDLGRDATILLSTHIMQEVEAVCDRVIIINRGEIVADDTLANLKQRSSRPVLRVGFEETLEPEWLNRLPGVLQVEKMDGLHWRLYTDDTAQLRRQILQLAADESLSITRLQTEGGSLEEIFRSLTTENASPPEAAS